MNNWLYLFTLVTVYYRLILILLQVVVMFTPAFSQLNNTSFYNTRSLDSSRNQVLYLGLDLFQFTKNNEYFLHIADGYTLFGFQFAPYLSYYPSEKVRIDAGIYLQKDFGNDDFSEIAPLLTVEFELGPFRQIFGNLESSLNHRYIEPLYDFERVMKDRLETGMQTKLETDNVFLDMWINWETMIYRNDPNQEELSGGISFYFDKKWDHHLLRFPLQFIAYHQGGQIDDNPDPIIILWNSAAGISYSYTFAPDSWIKSIHSDNYYLYYENFTPSRSLTFNDGDGWYLNLSIATKIDVEFMTSYWLGREFITIKGGALYPSVSSTVHHPDNVEARRELLMFRFLHNLKIMDAMTYSARFEPYYDLGNSKWEYSFGFYLNYYTEFYLSHIKGKPSK